jgi:hypothetical protein
MPTAANCSASSRSSTTRSGTPFAAVAQEGVKGLCETLAIAFNQRSKPAAAVKTKYDHLVSDAVISAQELELATRTARRKNLDVEEVLVNEFQVKLAALGTALGKFFKVPYEPFKSDRIKPMDLLKNLKRDFLEQAQWAPVEEGPEGVLVVCMDPEQVKGSRMVNNVFPRAKVVLQGHHQPRVRADARPAVRGFRRSRLYGRQFGRRYAGDPR